MSDLIDREAAIEYLKRIIDATNTDGRYNLGFIDGLEFCINHLSTEPSIQPEQKKGKWIKNEDGTWSCSLCHSWISYDQHYYARYCLYCGAKMEGE